MTDEEVSAKLKVLSGSIRGLDKKTEEVVGKLLVDEKDENVDADSETYSKLYKMIGGAYTFGIVTSATIILKYFEAYKEVVSQDWSNASPEEQ